MSKPAPTEHSFYVDPVTGSMKGDGSKAKPWHTLAEVVNAGLIATMPPHWDPATRRQIPANPNAPIKPGDTIYLLNGDHGVVKIQGYFGRNLVGYANSDFITIAALAGHTPVIEQLTILGGNKWIFRGLTFRSTNNTGLYVSSYQQPKSTYSDYWLVSLSGPHQDIIIDGNRFESQADIGQWAIDDWISKRASGLQDRDGHCVAITHNAIKNIGFGIATQMSTDVLIAENTIDYFSDDGIDYGSNNLVIEGNKITNCVEDGDGFHRDGMQGQPNPLSIALDNVRIKNNVVIRLTDPNLRFPGSLQGIDTFDGNWNNLEVTGNVVITNAWHGISFYGVHGIKISNNIVLGDSGRVLPCVNVKLPECRTKEVIIDETPIPGLIVHPSKEGVPSSDVTLVGNLANSLGVDVKTGQVVVRDNACITLRGKCVISIPVGGKQAWLHKPGNYGGNVVTTATADEVFAVYDPAHMKYDLTLKDDPRPSRD